MDFIGPLPTTNKNYQHIFTVIDAFAKFTWLYPVKSTSSRDTLDQLEIQQKTFGNPLRVITDRGSAFTSGAFAEFCDREKIHRLTITTGVPRGNGQVERIHRTLIPVLTKLNLDEPVKWFKHVDRLQRVLNSTVNRSTRWTPFELLIGVKMRNKEDLEIHKILNDESLDDFQGQRRDMRRIATINIKKIQEGNRRTYNNNKKKPVRYDVGIWWLSDGHRLALA